MYKTFKYLLILFCLQLTTTVVAQNYTLSYRVLESDDGLLGSRVISFLEDSDGFMWISTEQGIARYDGHQFQWFSEINSNLRGLPRKRRLVEDDEGYIWVVAVDKIDLIHTKTLEILPLEEKIKGELPPTGKISKIKQLDNHQILFKQQGNWYKYHSSTGIEALPKMKKANEIEKGLGGKLWLYKHPNILIGSYDLKADKVTPFSSIELANGGKPITNYTDKELFWLKSPFAISIWELKSNTFNKIVEFTTNTRMEIRPIFTSFLPEQNLLVTNFDWKNKGYSVIDLDNKKLIPVENSTDKIIHAGGGESMFRTQNTIWRSVRKSIIQLSVRETNFYQYLPENPHRGIRVFDNYLFSNKYKMSLDNPSDIQERAEPFFGVEQNIKNELWIGESSGIAQVDINKNTFTNHIPSKTRLAKFWSVLKSQEGQWWGSSYHNGLFVSNFPKNDSLSRFEKYNEFKELHDIYVNHLVEEGNYIWAASPVGLYLIHKKKGVVKKYNSDAKTPFQIPATNIHFLHKDASNTYWLATSSEGLIRFKINDNFEVTESKQYIVEDGLSTNVLYCIIEDDKERLWISTLNGISCFDKKTERIQVFSKKDGIQQLEFNRTSYTSTVDGRIYFGSIKGITAFYPDEVVKNDEYDIPVRMTKFLSFSNKNNKPIDQTKNIKETNKIIIQPTDRFFRMNVAMLDIFNSNKLRYAYKIEGLFNDYQSIDGNTIEIGGLPYGRYTLRVRGQGADRRFSKQELKLSLVVVRPFYLRWWFLLIVINIVGISIFQVYQWRVKQLEERKRELELLVHERTTQIRKDKEVIEERTAQIRKDKEVIEEQAVQLRELDEVKSKFFANISHELRTPLTLLLAPMEHIIKNEQLSNNGFTYLQMMRQNGNKLLKRINELLDLSRLDANRLEINEQPIFLYPFFKTLLSTVESAANLKGIKLLFKYQLDENIQVNLDEDKVEKIISNYLSNALKFTPKNGEIEFNVSKKEDRLLIHVRDTGIGILPNDLIKIFDRFYQTKKNNQQQGSGIGLSLCRELAKVLNGKVWVTSQIDQGSTFYLELPLVETFALKEKEVLEEAITPIITTNIPKKAIAQSFRPNILIVEDNADLRQLLTMILQEDYNVIAVENGAEALAELQACLPRHDRQVAGYELRVDSTVSSNHSGANSQLATRNPQLIISDIMMPVMDGIELLNRVKNDKKLQHIPMIMLTARQSLEVKIEALRIGVDDYLTKPFKEEELKARVANLIRNSQNRHLVEEKSETIKAVKSISQADLKWLEEVENIILNHIAEPNYKLVQTAEELNLSYRRLQQKVKAITGLSLKQYQRSIKLSKARAILKSGKVQTVSEVLYQIGFDNHNYFSKLYKAEYGIMPTEEL